LKDSLDYATLDQGDEETLNRIIQEQLGRGRARRRERSSNRTPPVAPQLPPGMLGTGQLLATQLLEIARKCGDDKKCLMSEFQTLSKHTEATM
jgi:hypothetical protein